MWCSLLILLLLLQVLVGPRIFLILVFADNTKNRKCQWSSTLRLSWEDIWHLYTIIWHESFYGCSTDLLHLICKLSAVVLRHFKPCLFLTVLDKLTDEDNQWITVEEQHCVILYNVLLIPDLHLCETFQTQENFLFHYPIFELRTRSNRSISEMPVWCVHQ